MKKLTAFFVLLSMLLSISLTLVGCGDGGEDDGEGTGDVGGGENEGGNTDADGDGDGDGTGDGETQEPASLTVIENYLPADVSSAIYASFEEKASSFSKFDTAKAPYTFTDVYTVSDARVLAVTIPVMATGAADENGNYIFTMYRVRNSYSGVCANRLSTYSVAINASQYELSDNQNGVYKTITVDLSSYGIVLSATDTLAFGASTDTIAAAIIAHGNGNLNAEPLATMNDKFPQAMGVFNNEGKEIGTAMPKEYTLCFDLVLERTFETAEERDAYAGADSEYDRIVAALKQLYAGKKISVLGDSITTFDGYTSNPAYNLTLSVNKEKTPYYPTYDKTTNAYTKTYWGRLLTELDMQLCVANAISGGFVSNSSTDAGDPFQDRAAQLHRDNGTKDNRSDDTDPDVIIMYQGINDLDNGRSTGNLLTELKRNNGKSDIEKVTEWFEGVLSKYKGDGSWVNFDEAYALAIYNMINKYGADVEIYCVTLVKNNSEKCSIVSLNNFNRVIKAIAEYFGATVIDQNGELSEYSSNTFYTKTCHDGGKFIHPNSAGHLALEHLIVKTMAEKNGLI